MQPFTYQYKGETIESLYAFSVEEGRLKYKVKLGTDLWFTIVPIMHPPHNNNKIAWHQTHGFGETAQPHELVQAMGEGIEATQ